jgi:large subunit ribosomal protein L4
MADKQEIKYKVRKIDGTYGAEGTISLNAIQDGGRYLVHRAFVAQSNKKRQGTASTKTRSEIRGGGKKPWKQKGTGNARSGSSNSPLWNGGGVAFGPRPRSYAHKINIKERRLALTTALHHNFSKVIVVEDLSQGTSQVSTKSAIKNLSSILDFSQTKEKKLVITHAHDKNLALSMRNVRNLKLISSNTINIIDLLDTDHILVTESALKNICEVYSE